MMKNLYYKHFNNFQTNLRVLSFLTTGQGEMVNKLILQTNYCRKVASILIRDLNTYSLVSNINNYSQMDAKKLFVRYWLGTLYLQLCATTKQPFVFFFVFFFEGYNFIIVSSVVL